MLCSTGFAKMKLLYSMQAKMRVGRYFIFTIICLNVLFVTSATCYANEDLDKQNKSALAEGKALFFYNCVACHSFKQDGIGPHLAGITKQVSSEWLKDFIKHPKGIIDSGDARAVALHERFKSYMPGFPHLTAPEMKALVAYLRTFENTAPVIPVEDNEKLNNPIAASIQPSGLSVNLELVFQIPASSTKTPATRITKLAPHPNTGNIFVLDLNGILYEVVNGSPAPYLNLAKEFPHFIKTPGLATGFGSFAFHPNFESNGLLYTTHTEPKGSASADFSYDNDIPVTLQWVLVEWQTKTPQSKLFQGANRELLRIDMVVQYHGIQNIDFNPIAKPGSADYGKLYLGIGDGGAVERGFQALVGSNQSPWGSILRIDPAGSNSANGHYGIPDDNPFSNEIYAYGFRNPHRFSWTSTAKMIAVSIGHQNIESIYVVEPGLDFGWPAREGGFEIRPEGNMSNVYPLPNNDKQYYYTYPFAQYDHDEGNAICGGYLYEGKAIKALQGMYVFGDIVNGRVFYVDGKLLRNGTSAPIKELQLRVNGKATSLRDLTKSDRAELRLGIDQLGEIYIYSKNDGKVYRLTPEKKA